MRFQLDNHSALIFLLTTSGRARRNQKYISHENPWSVGLTQSTLTKEATGTIWLYFRNPII
jgi:hypothetical protein